MCIICPWNLAELLSCVECIQHSKHKSITHTNKKLWLGHNTSANVFSYFPPGEIEYIFFHLNCVFNDDSSVMPFLNSVLQSVWTESLSLVLLSQLDWTKKRFDLQSHPVGKEGYLSDYFQGKKQQVEKLKCLLCLWLLCIFMIRHWWRWAIYALQCSVKESTGTDGRQEERRAARRQRGAMRGVMKDALPS